MRLFCEKQVFFQALSLVQKAINSQNTLPILGNILLKAEGQNLFLSATNLEIAISTKISASVKNEGSITIPARLIVNYVSFLKEGEIEIFVESGETICLSSKGSKTRIKGLPSSDFPEFPKVEKEFSFTFSAKEFQNSIEKVVFSCANTSTRPILSGALFWVKQKEACLVATDSYRLSEQKIPFSSEEEKEVRVIIPARTLQELSRILGVYPEEKVEIIISKNQIFFKVKNTEITSRLIEGNFPDYEQIIPKEKRISVKIQKEEFILGIKRVGIFAKENNNNIRISVNEERLLITTDATEIGSDECEIGVEGVGTPEEVSLNAQYVLDLLQSINEKEIFFSINEKLSPVLFKSKTEDGYVHIIMPLKV
jgi:DNA polymerase III subunit beta